MDARFLCLLLLFFLRGTICHKELEDKGVFVIVRSSAAVAETDDSFICATIDWWPPQKCNHDNCPWGQSSVLNLNLANPILAKTIAAFGSLRIRIGGSLQDQVEYDIGNLGHPCQSFSRKSGGLFGFSEGCLGMQRWDELNQLFKRTGAIITFGLNALSGRHRITKDVWEGSWNSSNARSFIQYTLSRGYPVDSWEFGNELSGRGISASVRAEQYGKDLINFKAIINELYRNSKSKPLILAPGGFFDEEWYAKMLQVSGPNVVNGVTHHIYNLGAGDDPRVVDRVTDPWHLSGVADTFRSLDQTIRRNGPWSSAWVGEAGGAYNNGSPLVSSSFLFSFWYLDQLGMASKYNTKVYCRQSLIGGNYGLLDTKTFRPNPDYFSALLWHRLMGNKVLSVDVTGSPYLRAYAHCRKSNGGVTILLINLHKSTKFNVSVHNGININLAERSSIRMDGSFVHSVKRTISWVGVKAAFVGPQKREEYHLTAKDGKPLEHAMLLNGSPLELTADGRIPELNPVSVPSNSPISLSPLSILFAVFPNFEARACQR